MCNNINHYMDIQTTNHTYLPHILFHHKPMFMFLLKFFSTPSRNQMKWSFHSSKGCTCLTFSFGITSGVRKLRSHEKSSNKVCTPSVWWNFWMKSEWVCGINEYPHTQMRHTITESKQRSEDELQTNSNSNFWWVWLK